MDKELKVGKPIAFDHIESETSPPSGAGETPQPSVAKKKPARAGSGSRIVLILTIIVALSAVAGAVALYVMKEEEIGRRLDVELQLQAAESSKQHFEAELRKIELERTQLITDIEQSRSQYRAAMSQLSDKEAEYQELQGMFAQRMNEVQNLKADFDRKSREASTLEQRLASLNSDHEEIKVQLGHIRMAKEALENRIIQMSKRARPARGVELEEVIVTAPAGGVTIASLPPPARLEGQVLVVNKEFAFVVINLGERDGLQESQVLEVFRGAQFMGKVKVERIYDTMSSAIMVSDVMAGDVKEGDIVKLM